jgi:hypothetical protein
MRKLLELGLALSLVVVACEESEERPRAYLPDCPATDPRCVLDEPPASAGGGARPGAAGGAGPISGSSGEGGAGGGDSTAGHTGSEDGGAPSEVIEIQGRVTQFVNAEFASTTAYSRNAVVEGEGLRDSTVSARWNGSQPFTLEGVRNQLPIWLSVRPEPETDREFRSLQLVGGESPVSLAIVRRELLEAVFGLLSRPAQALDDRAQAVLFLSDSAGRLLEDVVVELPAAELIAYARNGGWTDENGAGTSLGGLVVLGNITARSYPGNDVRVRFSGAASGFADIRIAAGAVTVAELTADP